MNFILVLVIIFHFFLSFVRFSMFDSSSPISRTSRRQNEMMSLFPLLCLGVSFHLPSITCFVRLVSGILGLLRAWDLRIALSSRVGVGSPLPLDECRLRSILLPGQLSLVVVCTPCIGF